MAKFDNHVFYSMHNQKQEPFSQTQTLLLMRCFDRKHQVDPAKTLFKQLAPKTS